MAELLATPDRIANKAGEAIESPEELGLALEMLESASNWVRFYAGQEWTAANAPEMAVTITIAAATRGYLNPAAYIEERADANFVKRVPGWANEAKPSPDEIAVLKTFDRNNGGGTGMISIGVNSPDRLVPRSSAGRSQPYFRFGWEEPFSLEPWV